MARLFISYKRDEQAYAFALRQWLIDEHGWIDEDIFVDVGHIHAGADWEAKTRREAEAAEVMVFLASDLSLDIRSFCYRELQHATGQILAVTIKGVKPDDDRILQAIPERARTRQITALDQEPTRPYSYVTTENRNESVQLNPDQVEGIATTLRELGVAPNSFSWAPNDDGPYPGLHPLQEGDEALFCGRDIEIRDGLKVIDDLRGKISQRALVIQAPSGAGKSSFLRAGLWRRLRQHAAFTPLAIIRPAQGAISNAEWGLAKGLYDTQQRSERLAGVLNLSLGDIETELASDPRGLFAKFADADAATTGRRTLLLGIDQAEEITSLTNEEDEELDAILASFLSLPNDVHWRLILTSRDDSVDATLQRLAKAGLPQDMIETFRLHRLPATRFDEIIVGPAHAAQRVSWPLSIDSKLVDKLTEVAGREQTDGGDALPILALALQRMVLKYRAPDGTITLTPDKAQDFIDSAVQDATNDALEQARATQDDLRRLIIPRLATWDPQAGAEGAAKRKVAVARKLFVDERKELKPLADALVEQRLLTTSAADDGATYEVSHEALLRVAPLGNLIYERREKYVLAHIVKVEANDWDADDRPTTRLARSGERLKEAQDLLTDPDFGAEVKADDAPVAEYLLACAAEAKIQAEREDELRKAELAAAKERQEAAETSKVAAEFSQAAAENVAQAAKKTSQRTTAGLIVAVVLAALAIWFALDASNKKGAAEKAEKAAETQRDEALITQSRFLADLAQQQVEWDHRGGTTAMLLSLAGLPDATLGENGSRPFTYEAASSAYAGLYKNVEQTVLSGHEEDIVGVAISPDGRYIVSGALDNTVRVWELSTGKPLRVLEGHKGKVRDVAISPDGRHVVSGSQDKTVRIWELATGKLVKKLTGHNDKVWSVAVSPSGLHIVSGSSDKSVRVWDFATGELVHVLSGHTKTVFDVAVSPDSRRIVSGAWDKTLRVWDLVTGKELFSLNGHEEAVYGVAVSPDGLHIVSGSSDETVRVWELATGKSVRVLRGHQEASLFVAISPDGQHIVSGSTDKTIRIWELETSRVVAVLKGHEGKVFDVAVSPDGRHIVSGSSDDTVRVWNFATTEKVINGHEGTVLGVAISANGRFIVSGAEDSTVRVWEFATGKQVHLLTREDHVGGIVAVRPDGSHVASTSIENGNPTIRVWKLESGVQPSFVGHTNYVADFAFTPDGRHIVSASWDRTLRIWEFSTRKQLPISMKHDKGVNSVALSKDGRYIVSGSDDNSVRVWEFATGKQVAKLEGHDERVNSVAVSPDGRWIASGSDDKTVRIWDKTTRKQVAILKGHEGHVTSVNISRDGRRVITGASDNTVRVWTLATGSQLVVLKGHAGRVNRIAISPDDHHIVSASKDKTVRVLRVFRTTQSLVDHAKRAVPRCFTQRQREQYYLSPEPPRWCITGPGLEAEKDPTKWQPKWPYQTEIWRNWLVAVDRGEKPELPVE